MNANIEYLFISKLRSALGYFPTERRSWSDIRFEQKACLTSADQDLVDPSVLLSILQERSEMSGMSVTVCSGPEEAAKEVARITKQYTPIEGVPAHVIAWRHELIRRLDLERVFASEDLNCAVRYTDSIDIGGADSSEWQQAKDLAATAVCGVTSVDWCLADSATLVMRNRAGQGRAASLLPPVHIAVISIESIISNLVVLLGLLKQDNKIGCNGLTNCMTFISGPSTTRDIESIPVRGAHGPKAVHIVVIN